MEIKLGTIIYLVGLKHFAIFQIREIVHNANARLFCFEVDQIIGNYDIHRIILYDDELSKACKTIIEQWEDAFITFNEEVFLNYIRTHDIT